MGLVSEGHQVHREGHLEKIDQHEWPDLFLPMLYSNNGSYMTDDMAQIT